MNLPVFDDHPHDIRRVIYDCYFVVVQICFGGKVNVARKDFRRAIAFCVVANQFPTIRIVNGEYTYRDAFSHAFPYELAMLPCFEQLAFNGLIGP